MPESTRIERLGERLEAAGADALVTNAIHNVVYLTDMTGVFGEEPDAIALVTPTGGWLVTDSRYQVAAGEALRPGWQLAVVPGDPWAETLRLAADAGIERLGVEVTLPHRRFRTVADEFTGQVVEVDGWIEELRAVKDHTEIERIATAQDVTDRAFDHILGFIAAGMTERDVALELEFHMRRAGSEGVAFPPIIASGPNSALPHAGVTDRVIRPGDFLKMDFGARVDGYCADMTRTIVVGAASERQREIYEAVRAANLAGLEALQAGSTGVEVDAVARAVIDSAGYGDLFGHGLGHGVGLEVHERPSVGKTGTQPLPADAVVTIEPGIYVEGFGGVRIEDLAVVLDGGCRNLTTSPKDLIEL